MKFPEEVMVFIGKSDTLLEEFLGFFEPAFPRGIIGVAAHAGELLEHDQFHVILLVFLVFLVGLGACRTYK